MATVHAAFRPGGSGGSKVAHKHSLSKTRSPGTEANWKIEGEAEASGPHHFASPALAAGADASEEGRRPLVIRFTNCRVLRNGRICNDDLWVQGRSILSAKEHFWEFNLPRQMADRIVDCSGLILAPGLIDLQVNGGFGVDFSSPTENTARGLDCVAKLLLRHGVTAFLPTIITSSPEAYRRILPRLQPRHGSASGAAVLGVHLEGPFISARKAGCHPVQNIIAPDGRPRMLSRACGEHTRSVRLTTLAPELPHAEVLISELLSEGITVSCGHSMADEVQIRRALDAGATMCTHMFNAMPTFNSRSPGIIGMLGCSSHAPYFGLIADGVHVHPASVSIAATARPDRVVLVTDAMAALGLPDGVYTLGGVRVRVAGDRAEIADVNDSFGGNGANGGGGGSGGGKNSEICDGNGRNAGSSGGNGGSSGTLAGGVVPLDECVRRFRAYCCVGAAMALECASLHAARALGIDGHKGTLEPGADADFILLDDDLNVQATFIGGELVWAKSTSADS